MRQGEKLTVRPLTEGDLQVLLGLEETVWKARSIEHITYDTAVAWLRSGGMLLGSFDGDELMAYVYAEVISFSPIPPYAQALLSAMADYTRPSHDPAGNALHGVSMASRRPRAGAPLLEALVFEARERGLRYFVSLARLEGFGPFVEKHRAALEGFLPDEAAALYAIESVSQVDPKLIGSSLSLVELPPEFPRVRRKDRVVSRFARIGKELWAVGTSTSFSDPESLGYSALLVLPL